MEVLGLDPEFTDQPPKALQRDLMACIGNKITAQFFSDSGNTTMVQTNLIIFAVWLGGMLDLACFVLF
jgi:hypothetical protein